MMTKDTVGDFARFRSFLSSIPLSEFRSEYKDIKWVEQDLHKLIYPLAALYKTYWEDRNFLPFKIWFEGFWDKLVEENSGKINEFKEFVRMYEKFYNDKSLDNIEYYFAKGFEARMYRTWVSVLTQFDFCYLFEYICKMENNDLLLETNAEMDARGTDLMVGKIKFQIKKISERKDALKNTKQKVIIVPYAVYDIEEIQRRIDSSRVTPGNRQGYRNALQAFNNYFIRLKNGFVVFKEDYLRPIIENAGDVKKVKEIVGRISMELAGEQ